MSRWNSLCQYWKIITFFQGKSQKNVEKQTFKRFNVEVDESSIIAYIIYYAFKFRYQKKQL